MSDVLVLALGFVLNAALPYAIVRHDLRRLSGERLSRAWKEASFLSAVVLFGPLSVPVHFTKTRRSLAGFFMGVGLAAAAVLCASAAVAALGWVLGVD